MTDRRRLNADDAAEYLDISKRTLQRWTEERAIPSSKKGQIVRYDRADLDAVMEKNKREAYPALAK